MNIFTRFFKPETTFARPGKDGIVSDGTTPGAKVGLYTEEAVENLVNMLGTVPDIDQVLALAGITRENLKTLLFDDEIAQAVDTRLDALLATAWRIEPNEGADCKKLVELLEPVFRRIITAAFGARLFGYSVMEAVYERRPDGVIGFKYIGEKPFSWFDPRPDGSLILLGTRSTNFFDTEVDQRYKFFLTTNAATYENPRGNALLSRLYWPWYFRQTGWKFWAKFLERFGAPLLVGKSGDPQAMVQALLMAHSQAVIGVDKDDAVEAIGSNGTGGASFEAFETALIRRIQKVILGQTLTSGTDGGSGNRALGQVHEAVRKDKRNSDIAMVLPTFQKVADALCELNGWHKHTVFFADEVGLEPERATRDKDLHSLGVRFTEDYFKDNYDLGDGDFTMASAPAAPADPANPEGGGLPKKAGDEPSANGDPNPEDVKMSDPSHRRLSFARFTNKQQQVEDLASAAIKDAPLPISEEELVQAIRAAHSPEDLADRLFSLIGDTAELSEITARAMFAADVMGYVHSEGKE